MVLRRIARDYFRLDEWKYDSHEDEEDLEQLLKNLKLGRILDIYPEQLRASEKDDPSYTEFHVRLLRAQWHARQENALEWRIRRAKFLARTVVAGLSLRSPTRVKRKQIRAFAELDFFPRKENIIVRRSHRREIRIGSDDPVQGHRDGYRCQFVPAQDSTRCTLPWPTAPDVNS